MSGDFRVRPDVLDSDGSTWDSWSQSLEEIGTAIPQLGAGLDPLAFSILPNAPQVAASYARAARALEESITDGVTQFTGFTTKLNDVATMYRTAEDDNLDEIATAKAQLEN